MFFESSLLGFQLVNLQLVQKLLCWRHTGFPAHSKVRVTSKQEAEIVGKYMICPILSLGRLFFEEAGGQVVYQYGKLLAIDLAVLSVILSY